MREDLLHFIWKYRKLQLAALETAGGQLVTIIDVGTHNYNAGPDFFNARIKIAEQLWAGNVEIHIKSSDWYLHQHEKDKNYENVILHVVWDDDVNVFRKDGSPIPVLTLKNYIAPKMLRSYQQLFDKSDKSFINCEKEIGDIDPFLIENWLERLYFERLENKSKVILDLLEKSNNDWESVLFVLLLKNFGSKINGESFFGLGTAINFSIVRKLQADVFQLEALFLGMAHLLETIDMTDHYFKILKDEFSYLQTKFGLENDAVLKPEFFKLRPVNFPTIRLSQMANLYASHTSIFDKLMATKSPKDYYSLFQIAASDYWNTHFTFGKTSKKSSKKLTKKFIDLLLINTVLPLKFCYAKYIGRDNNTELLQLIVSLDKERNTIVNNFENLGLDCQSAKSSQAFLQLYNAYCTQNKCLQCVVGSNLLNGNH